MSEPDEGDPWAPPAEEPADQTPGRPAPPAGEPGTAPPEVGRGRLSAAAGHGAPRPYGAPSRPAEQPRTSPPWLLPLAALACLAAFAVPLVGLALCAVVVVLARRARRAATAAGGSAPGALTALLLAVTGLVVPLLLLGLFYDEVADYTACVQRANTHEARAHCDAALERDLRGYLRR